MKKNMKFIVVVALTITTVLFIPKIVKGKDYVTSFDEMFSGCSSLVSLDLSGLYISDNVHTGENLFSGCSSLEFLDLSRLYLGVHNYKNMFNGCSKLKTIRMVGCAEIIVNKIKSELTSAGILDQVTIIT